MKIERDWNKFLMYEVLFIPLDNAKIIKPFLFQNEALQYWLNVKEIAFFICFFFAWGIWSSFTIRFEVVKADERKTLCGGDWHRHIKNIANGLYHAIFYFLSRNSSNCFTIFTEYLYLLAKIDALKKILPLFSYIFRYSFRLWPHCFTCSLPILSLQVRKNYLCFFKLWW
jgi:hypothetical protein